MVAPTVAGVLRHAGIVNEEDLVVLPSKGLLRRNEEPVDGQAPLAAGDRVTVEGIGFVIGNGGAGRLQAFADPSVEKTALPKGLRVHAGLHKCMTMFTREVYRRAARFPFGRPRSFRHFFHRVDAWRARAGRYWQSSISGAALPLEQMPDARVVRLIRDPRDLVVSSYFYHLRGAEHWCHLQDPIDADYLMVRGKVPSQLRAGESLTRYLNEASREEGLLAELEFLSHHFESWRSWPHDDPRVRCFRYEDILGREGAAFARISTFLRYPPHQIAAAAFFGRHHAAASRGSRREHIRNPQAGQWTSHFTPKVTAAFNERYGDLLGRYGYP